MVAAAHSTSHPDSARNRGEYLKAAGIPSDRRAVGDKRKTGHRGVHRLWPEWPVDMTTRRRAAVPRPAPATLPGNHRSCAARGRNAMAIWQDLVDGHGFSRVRQRQALRTEATRITHAGSSRGDRDGPRRRSPSRLRHRPHGARSAQRQVPAHAAVRVDAGPQPEGRSPVGVPIQLARLGRVARESVSPPGRSDSRGGAR